MRVTATLAICAALIACTEAPSRREQAQTAPPSSPPPIVVKIADGETREIAPAKFLDYQFTLPQRRCVVEGKIEGISGGNKDFETLILNDENFRNWSAKLSATGVQSGRKVVWSFQENIDGPGAWHFIVSNAFSGVTSKTVTVNAKATCPAT